MGQMRYPGAAWRQAGGACVWGGLRAGAPPTRPADFPPAAGTI